jgi:anti-anti-sigma factor
MTNFEATTVDEAGRIVVALAGDCDLGSRERLAATLSAAVDRSPVVVVDLADVRFLDSSGLHALVGAHHSATERAGNLYVVNASGVVATVLDVTGVGELLQPPVDAHRPAEGSVMNRSHD